jgi:asparagine synthase (glutamine-hydrolysing)
LKAWVHLYEDYSDGMFHHAQGQFAVSLWDRANQTLLIGRDRAGIAPLFYAESDGWLIWASEVKGILASGLIDAQPDRRGIDFFFNFFAISGERTCFSGVKQLLPGHYIKVRNGQLVVRKYRDLDFPDRGCERHDLSEEQATDELEELLRDAIRRRLVGEADVCSYLSGGLDSTTILGLIGQENNGPVPSFTISLNGSGPDDERTKAEESAHHLKSELTTLRMNTHDVVDAFPELIWAAESPVMDTSAACMIRLAQAVRDRGFKVSLTGEGADEALAGYSWFKSDQTARWMNRPSYELIRHVALGMHVGGGSRRLPPYAATGGVRTAQQLSYEMIAQSRSSLYSDQMWDHLDDYSPYDEVGIDTQRMRRWHPLNQSIYMGSRVMLPGMLLAAKGDRSISNASTEGRFPFLDERVVDFCASLPPRYKLRGLKDKWLLRQVARRILPRKIANRRKTMFRANMSGLFIGDDRPLWVDQLLGEEAIRRTGYFDYRLVHRVRKLQKRLSRNSFRRATLDLGLVSVIGVQLWHHTYCGDSLADLPQWEPPKFAENELPIFLTRLDDNNDRLHASLGDETPPRAPTC